MTAASSSPQTSASARFRRPVIAAIIWLTALAAPAAQPVWRCGWYPQPPLQYVARQGEVDIVTGLDVQLIHAVARAAGREVRLEEVPWDRQQEQLRRGECELAFGATWTAEREKFVRFSAPYRREENALYVRIGDLPRYAFKDPAAFLAQVRAQHLRLGIVKATAYLLPEVDAFVRDPANAPYLSASDTDAANLQALVQGQIDVALTERLAAATIATQLGYDTILAEHPVPFGSMEVRAMFSRTATTEADVADFNRALQAVQASGEFDRILRSYLLPPLLEIMVGGRWFYWLDLLGTGAFALSGVILAHRGRYNLVGAFVLAALPAVGGGLLRDLIANRRPVGVLRSPVPLLLVVGLVLAGYLVFKFIDRTAAAAGRPPGKIAATFDRLCGFFDTVGLAAFTIIGVRVAVETSCHPLWLWGPLLAALTGAGGGVLRDIVRADPHNATLKRGFYAEVALVWGLAFSLFLEWQVRNIGMDEVRQGTLVVLFGAFISRLLILRRGWENPFQLGRTDTRPERRLAALVADARALRATFPTWLEERSGGAQPRSLPEIETLHHSALRRLAALQDGLRELESTPLPPEVATRTAVFRREFEGLAAAEAALYELACEPVCAAGPARLLQEFVFAGVAVLSRAAIDSTASDAGRTAFLTLARERDRALEAARSHFTTEPAVLDAAERARMLQFAARFERLVQLLRDACQPAP